MHEHLNSAVVFRLTDEGRRHRLLPGFAVGKPANSEAGKFFGAETQLAQAMQYLEQYHVVAIEGGFRSGKTSLMAEVGKRMLAGGKVAAVAGIDMNPGIKPRDVFALVADRAKMGSEGKMLVLFDEIEAAASRKDDLIDMLAFIRELVDRGHFVAFTHLGDLSSQVDFMLQAEVRAELSSVAGKAVIVNTLLSDDEMRALINQGDRPLFPKNLQNFLVAEAGGHSYFGNILAAETWSVLGNKKLQKEEFLGLLLREESVKTALIFFKHIVEHILSAGFDPLTWEWQGTKSQPDIEVYRNMIPRTSSTIFTKWLTQYMLERRT